MKKKYIFILIILLGITLPNSVYAARGCCSHHGGVAYCDSSVGKYVCADGTYSPSCGCYKEVKTTTKKETTSTKTIIKKIEEDMNSEESTSSPVLGTLLLGTGGAYVYNEYKKTKLKK